jgi:hypothetical protein
MISILGDFDKVDKKLIIVILSKKNFTNSIIFVNNINLCQTDILKNNITRIILDLKSFDIEDITIKITHGSKTKPTELIKNINLLRVFEKVVVVNCDSTLGLEKHLWDKLKDCKSSYIIHCGDQIYNDKIFKKYYRDYGLNKTNIKKLKKEIFNNYYNQFKRYRSILKNNLNLMIPDDHEIVDDAYQAKYEQDEKFKIIFDIFKEFVKDIELALNFSTNDIYYLTDDINNTIYVLNYDVDFNEKILEKYDFDNKVNPYKNIVIVSRKSLLSSKNNIFNQLIFSSDKLTLVNIDFLLKKIIKTDKKMYVFCGDDHSYKKSIITYKNKNICEIFTCGPINTVPEVFKNKIILNTNLNNVGIKNKLYELANNFMQIEHNNDNLIIKNKMKKKSIIFYMIDNIINVWNLM